MVRSKTMMMMRFFALYIGDKEIYYGLFLSPSSSSSWALIIINNKWDVFSFAFFFSFCFFFSLSYFFSLKHQAATTQHKKDTHTHTHAKESLSRRSCVLTTVVCLLFWFCEAHTFYVRTYVRTYLREDVERRRRRRRRRRSNSNNT